MRRVILVLFVLLSLILLVVVGMHSDWYRRTMILREADRLYEDMHYDEALSRYESVSKWAAGNTKLKALFRIIECKKNQGRYGEAIQRISRVSSPDNSFWKTRFLVLQTDLYRTFLLNYGTYLSNDVIDGETDITRKTPEELRLKIEDAYNQLWDMRQMLARRSLTKEYYYFPIAKTSVTNYLSLWDYVVYKSTDYLLKEKQRGSRSEKLKASVFLQDTYSVGEDRQSLNFSEPAVHLSAILMDSVSQMKSVYANHAGELWKLERLRIPFKYPDSVSWSDDKKTERSVAETILRTWFKNFKYTDSRAEAGYELASMLQEENHPAEALKICEQVQKKWEDKGNATEELTAASLQLADLTRRNEYIELRIDPQLALTILNSLPFLVQYPHECVEQILNRYIPLAIVNEIYKKYPHIAEFFFFFFFFFL